MLATGGGAVRPAGGGVSEAGRCGAAAGSGEGPPDREVPQETTIGTSARREARPAVRRGVARLEPDVARLFSASTG